MPRSTLIEKIDNLGYRYEETWFNSLNHLVETALRFDTFYKHDTTLIGFSAEEEAHYWTLYNEGFLAINPEVVLIKASERVEPYYQSFCQKECGTYNQSGFGTACGPKSFPRIVGDSGIDLVCPVAMTISAGSTAVIDFEIACQANSSFFLMPRSSISKTPLRLANSVGLIDRGYRGSLMAVVDHIKPNEPAYEVKAMSRLFQIVLPDLRQIRPIIVEHLGVSARGAGGFGSTGV